MSLQKRIKAFVQLGLFLKQFKTRVKEDSITAINDNFYEEFYNLILRQKSLNGWFTEQNVISSLYEIGSSLSEKKLNEWISIYNTKNDTEKNIGVIMAGNIPLVGFHDMLCVLITGNIIQAKLASNDNTLIKKMGEMLIFIEPILANKIIFTEKLKNFDAVIATGSNNTSRYFEYYFGKYPHIIRKNRNSVAIINKSDGIGEVKDLGKDIFQYFGLGCRSVSKIYFPKGYRINTFFEAIYDEYQDVTQNNKYANNYDYNKAVYLMGNNRLLDNGFLLLKEEESLSSPVGVLNYEFYDSINELKSILEKQKNELQCIVSSKNTPIETLKFGQAQCPSLNEYADGIDTIKFLIDLS
ncbi:MAG: acyl-CoA reductase [Flavobacteriales bacterium]|nr:MAG: acyl-CoA reductase [Flavobacteriales bacterium]